MPRYTPRKAVGEYSIAEWQRLQRVNVDAAFVCAQAVLPGMRAAGSGRIVNISSITFFSAPESSFITGRLLCVDGGWIMH